MKQKTLFALLATLTVATAQADNYGYLTLQTADKATSVDIANGLTLTINDDGTLTAGPTTLTIADLTAMYFTTTPIELVTIGDMGWATNYSANAVDYTSADGLTAYQADFDDQAGTITIAPVTEAVAAAQGVLLQGEPGSYRVAVADQGTTLTDNDLTGAATAVTVTGNSYYALAAIDGQTVGFSLVNAGVDIPAGKAYYYAPNATRSYYVIEGATTGINSVATTTDATTDDAWYDLNGRRLATTPTHRSADGHLYPQGLKKGIYIKNGKKVIVK